MEDPLCRAVQNAEISQPTDVGRLPGPKQSADEVHEASTLAYREHDARPSDVQQHVDCSHQPAIVQLRSEEAVAANNAAYGLIVDLKPEREALHTAEAPSDMAKDTTVAAVPTGCSQAGPAEHLATKTAAYGSTFPDRPDADLSPSSGQVATNLQTEFEPGTNSDPPTVPEQQQQDQRQLQDEVQDCQHLQDTHQQQQETEPLDNPQIGAQHEQDYADAAAAALQQPADDNHGAALALALLGQAAVLPQALSTAASAAYPRSKFPAGGRHARLLGGAAEQMGYGFNGLAAQLLHTKPEGVVCQVPGCSANLTGAGVSTYFKRHRVCATHAKSDSVEINGVPMRFCQQCGIMHPLTEFDGLRKSCRVQLDRHNLRRRCRRKTQIIKGSRKQAMDSSSRGGGSSVSPSGAWVDGAVADSPPRGGKGSRAAARAAAAAFAAAAAESASGDVTGGSSREQEAEGYCYGDADYMGEMGITQYGMFDGMVYDHQAGLDPAAAAAAAASYPAGYYQSQQQQQQQGSKASRGIKKSASSSNMWEQQQQQQQGMVGYTGADHLWQMAPASMESYGNACGVQQQQQHMGQYYSSEYHHYQQQQQQQQVQEDYSHHQQQAVQWLPGSAAAAAAAAATAWPIEPSHAPAAAAGAGDTGQSVKAAEESTAAAKAVGLPSNISVQQLRLLIANAIAHGQGPGITAIRGLGFVQQMLFVDELATGVMTEWQNDVTAAAAAAVGEQGNTASEPSPRMLSAAAAAAPPSPAGACATAAPQQLLSLVQQLVKSSTGNAGSCTAGLAQGLTAAAAGSVWGDAGGTGAAPGGGGAAGPLIASRSHELAAQLNHQQQQQQQAGRKRSRANSDHPGVGGAWSQDPPAAEVAEDVSRGQVGNAGSVGLPAGLDSNLLRQVMTLAAGGGSSSSRDGSGQRMREALSHLVQQQQQQQQHDHAINQQGYEDHNMMGPGRSNSDRSAAAAAAAAGGGGGSGDVKGAALAAAAALLAAAGMKTSDAGSVQADAVVKMLSNNQGRRDSSGDPAAAAAAAPQGLNPTQSSRVGKWPNMSSHRSPAGASTAAAAGGSAAPGAVDSAAVSAALKVARENSSNQMGMSAALLKALSSAAAAAAAPDRGGDGQVVRGAGGDAVPAERTAVLLSGLLQQLSGAKR